jgi:hydrogenase maturation protease
MNVGAIEKCLPIVVIGYGNELRGDDGVGPQIARTVAGWQLPHVKALDMPQLLPELVETLAEAGAVVFVDACLGPDTPPLRTTELQPARDAAWPGHVSEPRRLLALAQRLHGRAPQARLLTIRADNLDYGLGLSPQAERYREEALRYLSSLLKPGLGSPARDRDG